MKSIRFCWIAVLMTLSACTAGQQTSASAVGQEFCAKATMAGPLVIALVDAAGVPVVVTGRAAVLVADACQVWDAAAVPVSPPTGVVPTVAIVPTVSK